MTAVKEASFARQEIHDWLLFDSKTGAYSFDTQSRGAERAQPVILCNPNLGKHNGRLSYPLKAFVNITKKCNLSCVHCYNSSGEPGAAELPAEILEKTFRFFRSRGIFKITLAGGEPTVHRHFPEIIQCLNKERLYVSVVSNGLLFNKHSIREVLSAECIKSVTVSLDGPDAESHNAIRGSGAYEATIRAVRELPKDRRYTLALRLTISTLTIDRLTKFVTLAKSLGVDEVKMNPMNPYGRARLRPDLIASRIEIAARMDAVRATAQEVGMSVEIPGNKYRRVEANAEGSCLGGREYIEIDANGHIYPCSFSWGTLSYGTVWDDDFDAVFLQMCSHSLDSPTCIKCPAR